MKKLTQLLTALVFGSLMIFISCNKGGNDPEDPDVRIAIGENLVSVVTDAPSTVTFDGASRDEWDSFSIAFTLNDTGLGGSYAISGVPSSDASAELVWGAEGATGTWSFTDDAGTAITGSGFGEVELTTVTASTVSVTLDNSPAGGRIAAFEGVWVFTW